MNTEQPDFETGFQSFKLALDQHSIVPKNEISSIINKALTSPLTYRYKQPKKGKPNVTKSWTLFFQECSELLEISIPVAATQISEQDNVYVGRQRRGWTPNENLNPSLSYAAYYCAHLLDDAVIQQAVQNLDKSIFGKDFCEVFDCEIPTTKDAAKVLMEASNDLFKLRSESADDTVTEVPQNFEVERGALIETEITVSDEGEHSIRSFDGVNHAYELAELAGVGWTQMSADSADYELGAELFCRQVSRTIGGRRIRYGLREVWISVRGNSSDIVRQYRSGEMDLPRHLHFHGDGNWRINASDGPTDNYGMLDGSVLAGPICLVAPVDEKNAGVEVIVYIPKTTPKIAILAENSDEELGVEGCERKTLIEKMFLIYLHKLHRINREHIILSSKEISA